MNIAVRYTREKQGENSDTQRRQSSDRNLHNKYKNNTRKRSLEGNLKLKTTHYNLINQINLRVQNKALLKLIIKQNVIGQNYTRSLITNSSKRIFTRYYPITYKTNHDINQILGGH